MLTAAQVDEYQRDGYVVVPDFVSLDDCDRLRTRANEMVAEWEPSDERSVFTTNEQDRISNGEFLASGASTWCFFEEEAFGPDGELTQPKAESINKIGHDQHDTDDEFKRFADNPELGEVARDIGMDGPSMCSRRGSTRLIPAWCHSKYPPARSWCCTASSLTGAARTGRAVVGTPTQCIASPAVRRTPNGTGCSDHRTFRCAVSEPRNHRSRGLQTGAPNRFAIKVDSASLA